MNKMDMCSFGHCCDAMVIQVAVSEYYVCGALGNEAPCDNCDLPVISAVEKTVIG